MSLIGAGVVLQMHVSMYCDIQLTPRCIVMIVKCDSMNGVGKLSNDVIVNK